MKIGVIGSGNMGGWLGKIWAKAGHQVTFSYSRDENKLRQLAAAAGENATVGTPEAAVLHSDIILLSVWLPSIEEVIGAINIKRIDAKIAAYS